MRARGRLPLMLLFSVTLNSGCSTLVNQNQSGSPTTNVWSGRLSLNVETDPPQAFFASFELKGSTTTGELVLIGPLGNILATLAWSPSGATLSSQQSSGQFDSLDSLSRELVGTDLPVHALFDWLAGIDTAASGWHADLSQLDQHRLSARRVSPEPVANLKLILDAPKGAVAAQPAVHP